MASREWNCVARSSNRLKPAPLVDLFLGGLRPVVAEAAPVAVDDGQHHRLGHPGVLGGGEKPGPAVGEVFQGLPGPPLQAVDHDVGTGQRRGQPLPGGRRRQRKYSAPSRSGRRPGRRRVAAEDGNRVPAGDGLAHHLAAHLAGSPGNADSSHAPRLPAPGWPLETGLADRTAKSPGRPLLAARGWNGEVSGAAALQDIVQVAQRALGLAQGLRVGIRRRASTGPAAARGPA